jgi:deoxyribodipyrimidine photo-lyase
VTRAIWWIRRDLRLDDNQALSSALAHADRVIPVFILDPRLLTSPYASDKRAAFLFEGLHQLDAGLRKRGSRLIVREGDPVDQLSALMSESGAAAIFAEAVVSPHTRRRDARVSARLPLRLTGGLVVHLPGAVVKADGKPYTVFTPFSRAWKALTPPLPSDLVSTPRHIETPGDLHGLPIPSTQALPDRVPFPAGEAEARRRLDSFLRGPIIAYADARNRMDLVGTSQLSPYLRFGMLSARQAVVRAIEAMRSASSAAARRGAEAWLNELIWREFYISILHHFPNVRRESFRADLRDIAWENDEGKFAAWSEGRTGYPIVDAAMRQLVNTGWMHNRARMIVASFLVKDLLVDWRRGEGWFMQHLVDGDPAANNGGWQWSAGTGTDAAPYFRVFNLVLQGMKFDPQGDYVRRWVPELSRVPDRFIHKPWDMPPEIQLSITCVIGRDYPAPIVDHSQARERVLAAYRASNEMT